MIQWCPKRGDTMKEKIQNVILHPVTMTFIGLFTGFFVKILDIYCYAQYLGTSLSDIFSQAGVWVVIGIVISLYSRTTKLAMINMFLFCAGMLLTYYITADVTNSVYGWTFIKAWAVFACFSPVMAWLARLTRNPGPVALLLKVGVFAGYIGLNWVLGSFLHYYDFPFLAALIYLLFVKKWQPIKSEQITTEKIEQIKKET